MAIITGSLLVLPGALAPNPGEAASTGAGNPTTVQSQPKSSYVGWFASGIGAATLTYLAPHIFLSGGRRMNIAIYIICNMALGGIGALLGIVCFQSISKESCANKKNAILAGTLLSGLGILVGRAKPVAAAAVAAIGSWGIAAAFSLRD